MGGRGVVGWLYGLDQHSVDEGGVCVSSHDGLQNKVASVVIAGDPAHGHILINSTGMFAYDTSGAIFWELLFSTTPPQQVIQATGQLQITDITNLIFNGNISFHDITSAAVAAHLLNGGRPIYYSKPGLPEVIEKSTNTGPSVGATPLVLASSSSIALDGNTNIALSYIYARDDCTAINDVFVFQFRDNGTTLNTFRRDPVVAVAPAGGHEFRYTTSTPPSAGNHVFDMVVVRIGGTGSITISASVAVGITQFTTSEFL